MDLAQSSYQLHLNQEANPSDDHQGHAGVNGRQTDHRLALHSPPLGIPWSGPIQQHTSYSQSLNDQEAEKHKHTHRNIPVGIGLFQNKTITLD